tara:strand:- start:805 stop:1374 length:570 start_codon:yes stop_codon:yes gene_type:complete
MKNKIKGGLADDISVKDIAKKHKVSVAVINKSIEQGVKVEKEHTSDGDVAYEIAKDHVFEDPKYYDKLKTIEERKFIIKRILKEDINLQITDENPDTTTVLVKYNGRNAGIIMVTPSRTDEMTLEIVGVKFKKNYEEFHIISEAINNLWSLFTDINSIITSPKLESVHFWNKLGFNRISPNYLISNRGH